MPLLAVFRLSVWILPNILPVLLIAVKRVSEQYWNTLRTPTQYVLQYFYWYYFHVRTAVRYLCFGGSESFDSDYSCILPLRECWAGMRPPAVAGNSHPGLSPSCEHRARWRRGKQLGCQWHKYIVSVVRMVSECIYSKVWGVGWSASFTPPLSTPY